MSLDQGAIQKIADLAGPKLFPVELYGDPKLVRQYSSAPLHNLPLPTEPLFPTVELLTLDSLADYVEDNKDKIDHEAESLICVDATAVQLVGPPTGENRRRDVLVKVSAGVPALNFGNWRPVEEFRIALMTQYEPTDDRDKIISLISHLADSTEIKTQDDGLSQSVTAKTGLATVAQVPVPNPVILKPVRTFIEVDQPLGTFLLRLRKGQAGPEAALFEFHTNWRREAAVRVSAYLKSKKELEGITILA